MQVTWTVEYHTTDVNGYKVSIRKVDSDNVNWVVVHSQTRVAYFTHLRDAKRLATKIAKGI